ncbi:aminoglycoside phosphotransferase family protein [Arthrobacter castelli]|uniref:aminoglycoside phosphotransferase family protein n=1 Tax=Arthrobacter castelli TaxID=271431 RepID=UPI0004793C83|nr:aminoglycoside phosphotransferase family protein [Arthrobacter castelli]
MTVDRNDPAASGTWEPPVRPIDPDLPALDLLFDPSALSTALGRHVRADHLRHKPGVSAVARLQPDDGGTPGWIAAYHRDAAIKAENLLRRSRQWSSANTGAALIPVPGPTGQMVVSGPLRLDKKLHKVLAPFAGSAVGEPDLARNVLNYNPFRRVVFSLQTDAGTVVCKAGSATVDTTAPLLGRLAAAGVPVVEEYTPAALPDGLPDWPRLRYYPWFGSTDLASIARHRPGPSTAELSRAAGRALAKLHAHPRPEEPLPGDADSRHGYEPDGPGRLALMIRDLSRLAPELGARLDRLRSKLAIRLARTGQQVLTHGDFSADQVLVDGGQVRLVDFDRASRAPAAADLGSFAAVELVADAPSTQGRATRLLPGLLEGYRSGGGTVNDADIDAWTAFHLLGRLNEPFRQCRKGWEAEMASRLTLAEEVLR